MFLITERTPYFFRVGRLVHHYSRLITNLICPLFTSLPFGNLFLVGSNMGRSCGGWGTGGTLTGAGEIIKAARPEVKIIAAEPEGAQMLAGKPWSPHKIQGWTPDFLPTVLNPKIVDTIVGVSDEAAMATAQKLATQEGIFCGISCGATMWAALQIAHSAPANSTFVVMLPDTGERYLSTALFENISIESDGEWLSSLGH